jgi:hypothetical protein
MNRLYVEVARRVVQLAGAAERKALFDYEELVRLPEAGTKDSEGRRLSRAACATSNLTWRVEAAQSVSRRALALFESVGGVVDWMPDVRRK